MSANKQKQMIRHPKAALNQRKKRYIEPAPEVKKHVPANKFKAWRDRRC